MHHSHKLYVLVDRNLSKSQQAVQACHAVAEFALKFGPKGWEHESLVLLGVNGSEELEQWMKTGLDGLTRVEFREAYYGDRMTALACWGCDDRVKDLRML